jgi:hypothetical protein
MFKTTNGGDTWIPEASFTTNNLHSVFFISENLGWVVGSNGTILRYGESSNSVSDPDDDFISQVNIFPNPFSSLASLEISVPENLEAEIDIYDISGRKIMQVFNGTLFQGSQTFAMDLTELGNGIYFCRISHSRGQAGKSFVICK